MSRTARFADFASALAQCGGGYDDLTLARVRAYKTEHFIAQLSTTVWPEQVANTALAVGLAAAQVPARPLRVLDFGGSAGVHYYAACKVLPEAPRWAIVETQAMAEVCRGAGLDAFESVATAVKHLGGVDLVHTSGAIQYTPDPLQFLDTLLAVDAPVFFLGRLPLWRGEQRVTIQESQLSSNGLGPLPPDIPDAPVRYPETFVNFDELLRRITARYELRMALDSSSATAIVDGQTIPGITLILSRRGL
jgi:putative methyltransferase (TIGR04325 family)